MRLKKNYTSDDFAPLRHLPIVSSRKQRSSVLHAELNQSQRNGTLDLVYWSRCCHDGVLQYTWRISMPSETSLVWEVERVLKRSKDTCGFGALRGCDFLSRHIGKCEDDDFLVPRPGVIRSKGYPRGCNRSKRRESAKVNDHFTGS